MEVKLRPATENDLEKIFFRGKKTLPSFLKNIFAFEKN